MRFNHVFEPESESLFQHQLLLPPLPPAPAGGLLMVASVSTLTQPIGPSPQGQRLLPPQEAHGGEDLCDFLAGAFKPDGLSRNPNTVKRFNF